MATGELPEEDRWRVEFYQLLARFLSRPPTSDDLAVAAALTGNETPLGKAVHALSRVASRADAATVQEEYHDLFIGVGRGELLPYGSYYLTGFLHEKPLGELRTDMSALGITADPSSSEPEDHAAAVLEMMAGLIEGRFGEPLALDQQKKFFDAHIDSWMPVFFRDLEGASSSVLYASLAQVGSRFLEIEAAAFRLD